MAGIVRPPSRGAIDARLRMGVGKAPAPNCATSRTPFVELMII